jgi:hypothetical protein
MEHDERGDTIREYKNLFLKKSVWSQHSKKAEIA